MLILLRLAPASLFFLSASAVRPTPAIGPKAITSTSGLSAQSNQLPYANDAATSGRDFVDDISKQVHALENDTREAVNTVNRTKNQASDAWQQRDEHALVMKQRLQKVLDRLTNKYTADIPVVPQWFRVRVVVPFTALLICFLFWHGFGIHRPQTDEFDLAEDSQAKQHLPGISWFDSCLMLGIYSPIGLVFLPISLTVWIFRTYRSKREVNSFAWVAIDILSANVRQPHISSLLLVSLALRLWDTRYAIEKLLSPVKDLLYEKTGLHEMTHENVPDWLEVIPSLGWTAFMFYLLVTIASLAFVYSSGWLLLGNNVHHHRCLLLIPIIFLGGRVLDMAHDFITDETMQNETLIPLWVWTFVRMAGSFIFG
jgi:hypothetical protein